MRKLSCGVLGLYLVAGFGCGGADEFTSDDAGGSAGASAGSGGAMGGSSGSGGSGGSAGNSSGGTGAASSAPIDPLSVGNRWTYDVEVLGTYPICRDGEHSGEVLSTRELGGRQAFQVQSLCPGAGVASYAAEGDRVWVYYAGAWVLALDAPVEAGHTWTNGASEFTWVSAGTVATPAGQLEDCWTAEEAGSASFTTFCRGVGPVHWHYEDPNGNGYDATLTDYELVD